ncbi:MAG: hypothetical protein CEN92_341 [Candidatus Berkelbacteria bacterium Licking1014_96]|uniref:Uncharacterized protein n=1 Tax=Candidatus Berkelbacteria bacterium Licking1014_96 TaxID=2017149 RepID=A0A554LEC6_9BACT|nr:MAG: hypothetical protein CEN92_341 [Candidatus Berkelbacteria bacterium Licking1014_96]
MKPDKKYIWDYDLKSIDLKNKRILRWYLSRKINFGDWESLKSELIKKHLDYLEIDPTLKQMLKKYYASKKAEDNS